VFVFGVGSGKARRYLRRTENAGDFGGRLAYAALLANDCSPWLQRDYRANFGNAEP